MIESRERDQDAALELIRLQTQQQQLVQIRPPTAVTTIAANKDGQ